MRSAIFIHRPALYSPRASTDSSCKPKKASNCPIPPCRDCICFTSRPCLSNKSRGRHEWQIVMDRPGCFCASHSGASGLVLSRVQHSAYGAHAKLHKSKNARGAGPYSAGGGGGIGFPWDEVSVAAVRAGTDAAHDGP